MRPAVCRGPGQYGWGMGSQETAVLSSVGNRQQQGFRSGREARMPRSPGPRRQLKAEQPLLTGGVGSVLDTAARGFSPSLSPTWLQSSFQEWQGSFAATQKKARSVNSWLLPDLVKRLSKLRGCYIPLITQGSVIHALQISS